MRTNWYYFRSRVILQLFTPLVLGGSLFGQSDSSHAELTVTNLHLDCGLVTPESDKEAVPTALSQRLSGDKVTVWICSPVSTCPTLQSPLPQRGVGGILWVLGISGVKKVGCGCCTGVKWYVEGGAEAGSGDGQLEGMRSGGGRWYLWGGEARRERRKKRGEKR